MRFRQRMNVLLPHPDGPMNAVTAFLWMSERRLTKRKRAAVPDGELLDVEDDIARADVVAAAPANSPIRRLSIAGVVQLVRHLAVSSTVVTVTTCAGS